MAALYRLRVHSSTGKPVVFCLRPHKHYRFKSLIAPSDVYFELDEYNFAEGQPVRLVKRIDLYAQKGWSGDVIPHLVEINGDIYDQSIE